ncbi:hypothetical protein V6N12_062102 [Hibiscus sabdariffa]|uniref:Uncharacterized protein n=1 Tax=Hibiscus sabdariffa TaxID=183260 RepID=A0ABR2F7Y6_9ROSI
MTSRAAASTAAAPVAVAPVTVPVKHHQQRKALAVLYALTEMESREGHWNPTKMALKPSDGLEESRNSLETAASDRRFGRCLASVGYAVTVEVLISVSSLLLLLRFRPNGPRSNQIEVGPPRLQKADPPPFAVGWLRF